MADERMNEKEVIYFALGGMRRLKKGEFAIFIIPENQEKRMEYYRTKEKPRFIRGTLLQK